MKGAGVAVVGISSRDYDCEDAIAFVGHQYGTCHNLACVTVVKGTHSITGN